MTRKRRQFSPQFKAKPVQFVLETGRPVAEIAREVEVNEGTPGNPTKPWVVSKEDFAATYVADDPEPGMCRRTGDIGLTDFAAQVTLEPGQVVSVWTKENLVTVDPADFMLACGPGGEFWPVEERIARNYTPKV